MPTSAAAEFPNDNPALHTGARWLCRGERGPARAVITASDCRASDVDLPLPPRLRPLDGPMELELGRIILMHRVENVPPPPDFLFTPFSSSRPLPVYRCEPVGATPRSRRLSSACGVETAPCLAVEDTQQVPASVPAPVTCVTHPEEGRRRREAAQGRRISLQPLGESDELQRAIAELEAAFDEPRPALAVGA